VIDDYRLYGTQPYRAVLVHGGPGARGELAPVARELSSEFGVVEAFQTAGTIGGLVAQLHSIIKVNCGRNVTLVGHSWGAWLVWLYASQNPDSARKIVLVGAGPFQPRYADGIMEKRFSRLSDADKAECVMLANRLNADPSAMERFGGIMRRADTFDETPGAYESGGFDMTQYDTIWPEAEKLRSDGRLLDAGRTIRCRVTAIHGDYDPHPADGVRIPLMGIIPDLKFVLLKDCGHSPWVERQARGLFFDILKSEILE